MVSMAVVSVVGISLGLSGSGGLGLSGPLAVVTKTVSVVSSVVSKTGVSVVSKTVYVGTTVSKTVVSMAVVSVVGISLGLSGSGGLSLSLSGPLAVAVVSAVSEVSETVSVSGVAK